MGKEQTDEKKGERGEKNGKDGQTLPPGKGSAVEAAQACRALVGRFDSLLLSTLAPDGGPELSYAPCLRDDAGAFWIYVSALAAHTRHLARDPRCAVLFIQDEGASRNLFARERLSLRCRAHREPADSPRGQRVLQAFQDRHGETVALLRSLPDFSLFRLVPEQGRYIQGFGRAFDWHPPGELTPVGPPGDSSNTST